MGLTSRDGRESAMFTMSWPFWRPSLFLYVDFCGLVLLWNVVCFRRGLKERSLSKGVVFQMPNRARFMSTPRRKKDYRTKSLVRVVVVIFFFSFKLVVLRSGNKESVVVCERRVFMIVFSSYGLYSCFFQKLKQLMHVSSKNYYGKKVFFRKTSIFSLFFLCWKSMEQPYKITTSHRCCILNVKGNLICEHAMSKKIVGSIWSLVTNSLETKVVCTPR